MTLKHPGYSPEEVASRGEALYQQLRGKLEQSSKGRFLVMDIETGDFEVAADDLEATQRLLARGTTGILYGVRIGSPAAYHLRGHGNSQAGMRSDRQLSK